MKILFGVLIALIALPAFAETNIACPYRLNLNISDRGSMNVSMPNAKVLSLVVHYKGADHSVAIANGARVQAGKLADVKVVMDHGTSEKSILLFDLTHFSKGDPFTVKHSLMRGFEVVPANDLICEATES